MPREERRVSFNSKVILARLAKQGRAPSILELAIIRVGLLQSGQLVLTLWWWSDLYRTHGLGVTGDHIAAVAHRDRSTGYRFLAKLREAFTDQELVVLADHINAVRSELEKSYRSDKDRSSALGAEVVPLAVA